MPYQVALLNFEGPLDLLLQLIEKSDLEITDITISEVTSQYLTYIEQLPSINPIELNQFLDLAARLIYLKSVALLPSSASSEDLEDFTDLAEQLEQYRHYQKATQYLDQLLKQSHRSWPREAQTELPPHKLPLPNVTMQALERAFADCLAALPTPQPMSQASSISLEEMTKRMKVWLSSQSSGARLTEFIRTLADRLELTVAFIALLELVRQHMVGVSQDQLYGDIIISSN